MNYIKEINSREIPLFMDEKTSSPMKSIQRKHFGLQHDAALNRQDVLLESEELLLKFIRKNEEPRIAKLIFKKMKKGRLTLLHIVIKST